MAEDADVISEEGQGPVGAAAEMSPDDLSAQLSKAQSLAEERLDLLKRCRADLDNVIKRSAREKDENVKYASEKLICKLLPALDSLEQAAKHDEGAKVLYSQLLDILKTEGLVPMDEVGKKFDPYRHEALFQVKSKELDEDTVAEVVQKGYLFNSHVIRFCKVAVAKR
ncbi:MAG: nucleotide exchange factor GrpE [Methanothrix sp.]|nr:MAG: nucleotide exchange factor GrpE [Methanothrix sp.]